MRLLDLFALAKVGQTLLVVLIAPVEFFFGRRKLTVRFKCEDNVIGMLRSVTCWAMETDLCVYGADANIVLVFNGVRSL